MTGGNTKRAEQDFEKRVTRTGEYDPFVRGQFPVGVRTIQALDKLRDRLFPCEIWYPAGARHEGEDLAPGMQDLFTLPSRDTPRRQMAVRNAAAHAGTFPLIVFSHASGYHRRMATYLCTHLSSHGYVAAALDHSEVVAAELARKDGETDEQRLLEPKPGLRTECLTYAFSSTTCLVALRGPRKRNWIPLRLESWDTASEDGQHWLQLASTGVYALWWRLRQAGIPIRNLGLFPRSLVSPGGVTFRRSTWLRSTML